MTVFRATFRVTHESGDEMHEDLVLAALESALDDRGTLVVSAEYSSDREADEGRYSVLLERVEVAP